jgi:tRNA threonylcarbamoyladenosine modification (KEOPS) complex  Pcc1 subunit
MEVCSEGERRTVLAQLVSNIVICVVEASDSANFQVCINSVVIIRLVDY